MDFIPFSFSIWNVCEITTQYQATLVTPSPEHYSDISFTFITRSKCGRTFSTGQSMVSEVSAYTEPAFSDLDDFISTLMFTIPIIHPNVYVHVLDGHYFFSHEKTDYETLSRWKYEKSALSVCRVVCTVDVRSNRNQFSIFYSVTTL